MRFIIAGICAFIVAMIFVFKSKMLKSRGIAGRLYAVVCSFITIMTLTIVYSVLTIASMFYYNTINFNLNNKDKCIIYSNIAVPLKEESKLYYEANFKKNTINIRYDTDKKERIYKASIIKNNIDEIEEIVKDVISDEKNLREITEEDKQEFFRNQTQTFFHIKTYDGKIYYVKDIGKSKKLYELVSDFENKTAF